MALHWYGKYDREQFAALSGSEQSRIIALWLIDRQVESIVSMEHVKQMKRAQG